jgi:hypothetical protein
MSVETAFLDSVFVPMLNTAKLLYLQAKQCGIEWDDRNLASVIPNDSTPISGENIAATGAQIHSIVGVMETIVGQIDADGGTIRKLIASVGDPVSLR